MTRSSHIKIEPEISRRIVAALKSTGIYSGEYEVLRQASSGSRSNYEISVINERGRSPEHLWCRTSPASVDGAFADRFTLQREARVIHKLTLAGVPVPEVVATSDDGLVVLQRYIDEDRAPAGGDSIGRYMKALDHVHSLSPVAVLPDGETEALLTAADAVGFELDQWLALASATSDTWPTIPPASMADGLAGMQMRLNRIVDYHRGTPLPALGGRAALVHGDAGRANFVVDSRDRLWLIDWELSHAGHPYEDFAWIELRGLEDDSSGWCDEVVTRIAGDGPEAVPIYRYLRSMIYFRSVIAIAARILATPSHDFVPYLTDRLVTNEHLGWLSTGATDDAPLHVDRQRLDAWTAWSDELDLVLRGEWRTTKGAQS